MTQTRPPSVEEAWRAFQCMSRRPDDPREAFYMGAWTMWTYMQAMATNAQHPKTPSFLRALEAEMAEVHR